MRKTIVNGICLLLMAVGAWQCTPSSEYKLVDFKDIGWIYSLDGEFVERNTRYSYQDGILVSKIDIQRKWTTNKDDSTYTEYETNIYDDRIDSVETTWRRYSNDSLRHVWKTIKSYSLDGVIMKNVIYDLSDSGWVEGFCTSYNASGQKTEEAQHGQSFKWYYYDSLNRYTGQRERKYSYLTIDTAIYSDDGLNVVWTRRQQNDDDSIPTLRLKILYKLDKHGRVIHEKCIDYDTIGYVRMNYTKSYKYNRRGQLVSQITGYDTSKAYDKTEYRYRRGLKTWELYYEKGKLDRVYRYKNDYRHKLPLERALHSGYSYDFNGKPVRNNFLLFLLIMTEEVVHERLVWTYEK